MAQDYPQWKQKSYYGGFSDDRFMGIENSFAYAKGVEIRKNPRSLTLSYAVEKDSGSIVTDWVLSIVTIKSTGDIIGFGDTGKIYRKTAGAGSWVNCYTQPSNLKILNGYEYNGYLYWATAANLHRIAVANIDDAWSGDGTLSIDYKAFANDNANAHPMIELNNKLYVGDGYYLAELDSLGTWTDNKLSVFHDEEIRAITFGGSVMRIFTRKSTKLEGGHKYHWNGTDESYSEKVFCRQAIHCAVSNGGKDYVIAGRRPFLYDANGYEWVPLKRLPLVFDDENCYLSPNAMDYFDNLVVFGTVESGNASIGRGVWTWGQEDNKYPISLNFDYPTSNDDPADVIGAVSNANGVLYFSWKKTAAGPTYSYGIDIVNTAKYRATGELISRVHYGEEADEQKAAIGVKMAFDTLAAGEKIQLFLKKNLAASFPGTAELTADYTDTADRNVVDKRFDEALTIADYNFLESRLVLTAGTSQLTTPEVIEVSVLFDPDIELGD